MELTRAMVPLQLPDKVRFSSNSQDDWDEILEDGETILWQGTPVKGILFTEPVWSSLVASAVFIFMSFIVLDIQGLDFETQTLHVNGVKQTELPNWVVPIGYFLLILGLLIPIIVVLIGKMKRARTFYTLTNKRAFVGKDYNERRLLFHRFHPFSKIRKSGSKVGNVTFFFDWERGEDGDYLVESGFDNIKNPAKVFTLVLKAVQEVREK